MDRDQKNRILDQAVNEIQGHPRSLATLVEELERVFSEGYKCGLHQGRVDKGCSEGCDHERGIHIPGDSYG